MAEKDTLYKGKLKHTGVFDFSNYYSFAYDWLIKEDYDLTEKKYSEKVLADTKTIEIQWEADKKVSDYFKFRLKMEWQITGLKKIKVKKGEHEISMDSGSIEIKFSCQLIKDWDNRWEGNPTFKFLRGVYDRYIIRNRVEEYENKVISELLEIITETKSYLALEAR